MMRALTQLLVSLVLASCQTTGTSPSLGQATESVAGTLLVVPLLMERCEAADPGNRQAYSEEKARYEARNKWVRDAAYRVLARRMGSTQEGVEAFVRGVGQTRVDAVFAGKSKVDIERACLKGLSSCRLGEPSCGPIEAKLPAEVKVVVDEAAR